MLLRNDFVTYMQNDFGVLYNDIQEVSSDGFPI